MKGKWKAKIARLVSLMAIIALTVATPTMAIADDFSDYNTPAGYFNEIDLPEITGGWFDAIDFFPPECTVTLENNSNFELKGRMILANNHYLFIQKTNNSSGYTWQEPYDQYPPPAPLPTDGFQVAAYVPDTMDPTSIRISPDGSKVALLPGYTAQGMIMYVFDAGILNTGNPPDLSAVGEPAVKIWSGFGAAYEMEWVDNRYIAVNQGQWPGPPYGSGIYIFDTNDGTYDSVIGPIPGASAGVTVNAALDVVTGNGLTNDPEVSLTGEVRIIPYDTWWNAYSGGTTVTYLDSPVVAESILSSAALGFDAEGNLHVGGANFFGTPIEKGFAALVHNNVITRVLEGGDPVDEDIPSEYKTLAPDPAQNDSSTSPINFNSWARQLVVCWNPYGSLWGTGVIPRLAVYSPGSALTEDYDTDLDDIPNGSDNAYLTPNSGQQDTDGDGYGNICDCDVDNNDVVDYGDVTIFFGDYGSSGPDIDTDFDSNGVVAYGDVTILFGRHGQEVPFY